MASFIYAKEQARMEYAMVGTKTEQQRRQYPELPVTVKFNTFCLLRHAAALMSPKYAEAVYAGPPPGNPEPFVRRLIWC